MIGFKPKSRRASTPEIDSRAVRQSPELTHIPAEMVERKLTLDHAEQLLENTYNLRFLNVGSAKPLIPTNLRIMRGVAKPEEAVDNEEEISVVTAKTEVKPQVADKTAERAEADAKVIKLDEHRARYLMDKDARRLIDEAYDVEGNQVVAEVVETQHEVAPIPDVGTVDPAVVIEARAEVERALQAQAEDMRISAQRKQDTADLMAFMAEHHQQRRTA